MTAHFRTSPCVTNVGGEQTDDPKCVTCPACKPIAAKHQRGAALQAFEECEVSYRAAEERQRETEREASAARHACGIAKERLDGARATVLRLVTGEIPK